MEYWKEIAELKNTIKSLTVTVSLLGIVQIIMIISLILKAVLSH